MEGGGGGELVLVDDETLLLLRRVGDARRRNPSLLLDGEILGELLMLPLSAVVVVVPAALFNESGESVGSTMPLLHGATTPPTTNMIPKTNEDIRIICLTVGQPPSLISSGRGGDDDVKKVLVK